MGKDSIRTLKNINYNSKKNSKNSKKSKKNRNNGYKILNRINAFKSNNSLRSNGSDSNKNIDVINNKLSKVY